MMQGPVPEEEPDPPLEELELDEAVPASPGALPGCATAWVHCGVWLCVVMSWKGSQKATREGSVEAPASPVPLAADRLIAAIQSCGCWHSGSNFWPCAAPGVSYASAG